MIAAIVAARMSSTRLPGKVMKRVLGKTLLEHLIERLKRSKTLDDIIIATTLNPKDKKIESHIKSLGVKVFRGDENDVLDRHYRAARHFSVDTIVRITSDCPLMDPVVVDKAVRTFLKNRKKYKYVSNLEPQTYPIGMAIEAFSFKTLEDAWRNAKLPMEREHVTPFIRNNKKLFPRLNVVYKKNCSDFRITVDEPDDFRLVKIIFERLYPKKKNFGIDDVINLLEKNPELAKINAHVNTILQKKPPRK